MSSWAPPGLTYVHPAEAVLVLGPTVVRAEIPALCERLVAVLRDSRADVVVCDVSAITRPDAVAIEALARLRLTAQRFDRDIRIDRASRWLCELAAFAGLDGVLGVEPRRQAE